MTDFLSFINDHAEGDIARELGEAIDEVAQAVVDHDKKGEVTLKLTFNKSGRMVIIGGDVTAKVPKADMELSAHYVTDHGLSRDDPLQMFDPSAAEAPHFEVNGDGELTEVEAPPGSPRNPLPAA